MQHAHGKSPAPRPPLESFGPRLMICGTSNTGKSTLSAAISARCGWPVVHLDQLRFLPNTDWAERPDPEFKALAVGFKGKGSNKTYVYPCDRALAIAFANAPSKGGFIWDNFKVADRSFATPC